VDYIEDEMFYLQVKYPQIIYSHETALYLHGLTDRAPFEYSTTVPSGYNVVKNLSENVKV
jgi:predicted transcriptional regulator of viral defense system